VGLEGDSGLRIEILLNWGAAMPCAPTWTARKWASHLDAIEEEGRALAWSCSAGG